MINLPPKMFALQTQPNLKIQEQMAHRMGGCTINPAKHCGNGWCIRGRTATSPTKATKAGIDGVPAQPLNLEAFQGFCRAAGGKINKKHQTSRLQILRDSWHRWCNQL